VPYLIQDKTTCLYKWGPYESTGKFISRGRRTEFSSPIIFCCFYFTWRLSGASSPHTENIKAPGPIPPTCVLRCVLDFSQASVVFAEG